ncbi:MAG TPA: GNAT family protein [Hyphomicrobiaceae bacterium]|nr:GNAT family protein [Hyphomicrobiaceae bacterium]
MAFLRAGIVADGAAVIEGHGVWLRPPQLGDYAAWAELRAMSRAHLVPWEPAWPRDDLTKSAFRRRLRHYHREARDDLGYAFSIFGVADDRLVGGLTLSNVRRGVSQAATLGYWLGLPYVRRGLMTEAVRALVPYAFDVLRLHRIEAAVQPNNCASIRVLERLGFTREGYACSYLKINGAWQDHVLFALLAGERRPAEAPSP